MEPGAAYWRGLDKAGFPDGYDPRETDLYGLIFLIFGLWTGTPHHDFTSIAGVDDLMEVICVCTC